MEARMSCRNFCFKTFVLAILLGGLTGTNLVSAQQPMNGGFYYPYAPSAAPVECETDAGTKAVPGIIADAEWLGWQIDSSNQNFATYNDPVWLTERKNFDSGPDGNGVRARLGLRTESMWDVIVGYTYFKGDDSGSVSVDNDPSSILVSTRSRLDLATESVSYNDSTELNAFDLEIGHSSDLHCLNFRPFGGFRWVQLDQTQGGEYTYRDDVNILRNNVLDSSSKLNAYGIRMGMEASVKLFGGLRAFGRGAGSALVGKIESTGSEIDEQMGTVLDRNFEETISTPVLEAAAGLAYGIGGFEIKGGYEFNSFFNAANFNGERSDVSARGFFAGVSFNY